MKLGKYSWNVGIDLCKRFKGVIRLRQTTATSSHLELTVDFIEFHEMLDYYSRLAVDEMRHYRFLFQIIVVVERETRGVYVLQFSVSEMLNYVDAVVDRFDDLTEATQVEGKLLSGGGVVVSDQNVFAFSEVEEFATFYRFA